MIYLIYTLMIYILYLDIYLAFISVALPSLIAEFIFFSTMHGTYSKINRRLSPKAYLLKVKRLEFVSIIFSDQDVMKTFRG